MTQVNMRRYNTQWKRRARNVSEQSQELNCNTPRPKKRTSTDRLDPTDDLLDNKILKKAKCMEDESLSVQILTMAAKQPYLES